MLELRPCRRALLGGKKGRSPSHILVVLRRCVEEYKLAPDGKSCLMLSDICEGPKCLKSDAKFNDTLFGEMLHGYNNRSQHVNQGQVFQMTFRYGPVLLLVLGTSGW